VESNDGFAEKTRLNSLGEGLIRNPICQPKLTFAHPRKRCRLTPKTRAFPTGMLAESFLNGLRDQRIVNLSRLFRVVIAIRLCREQPSANPQVGDPGLAGLDVGWSAC